MGPWMWILTIAVLLIVPEVMALGWLIQRLRFLQLPLPRWPERLLPAHRFNVTAQWWSGEVMEREVRVRGLTMKRAWVKLLERPTHPEVAMRMVGPLVGRD